MSLAFSPFQGYRKTKIRIDLTALIQQNSWDSMLVPSTGKAIPRRLAHRPPDREGQIRGFRRGKAIF
jgi:hypothetical protein